MKGFDDFELKLGDIMRGERATLGKSLLDVQRDLKIKAAYISAIESTDLTAFETPGFIAGYVRSYARYLGMDPDETWRTFCAESGFSHLGGLGAQVYVQPERGARRPRSDGDGSGAQDMLLRNPLLVAPSRSLLEGVQPGAIGSLAVLLALIGGLGYGAFAVLQEIQRVTVAPVETELSALPGSPGGGEALVAEAEAPSVEALDRLYRPRPLDRPVLVARDGPIATLDPREHGLYAAWGQGGAQGGGVATEVEDAAAPDPAPAPEAVAAAGGQSDPAPSPAGPGDVVVTEPSPPQVALFARRPAWVRVRAADGAVLLEKILDGGESWTLPETEEPPVLRAGNSGSLYFAVDGQALGPAGGPGTIAKNVALDAASLKAAYGPADLEQDPELARLAALMAEAETIAERP